MKRFIFGICLIIVLFIAAYFLSAGKEPAGKITVHTLRLSPTATAKQVQTTKKTLFVPYWTMNGTVDSSGYDKIVYFGITVNKDGIDENEIGYKSMHNFIANTDVHTKRLLGVRLLNTDINTAILDNKKLQQKIITRSIAVAKENGFDGIVFDFEISALGFDSVTKNISNFETLYADSVKKNKLSFYATIYGDVYARFRPFDVKTIAAHTDGIMIMAYDFHKANGNPGPNFPLKDNQDEGYDFQSMIHDFLQQTSPDKVTVVFGLYGYDWTIDDKGNTSGEATSLSEYKIIQKFLKTCPFSDCNITRDPISSETKITYIDNDNQKHIVWFEDIYSVNQKTTFLRSQGISAIAYWAYSYF